MNPIEQMQEDARRNPWIDDNRAKRPALLRFKGGWAAGLSLNR